MSPQRSGSAPLDPPALLGARLPAVLRRLRTVLAGDPFDATRVEELVALDPVLAAQVLHHCTDPPAGRQPAPLSLREAIRRLGANSLHQICRVRVPSPRSWNWESGRHRIAWLYEHSVVTASFGRLLASELAPGHEEDAHLAGLVHDLGMFALLERFGSRYVRFLETNSKSEARLTELERRELGDSHEEVGVELVRAWKLPSSLYSVVGGHHGPGRMERRGSLVEIVGLAERLTRAAGLAGPLSQDGGPEEMDRLMTELELPPRLRRRAPVMLEEAMARIASVHDATSSAPGALARTLSESRVTPPEIRSPALSKTARLLRDGDRIHTEAELGLWLRKVVLQETAFERAMVFLADERQETLREVLDEREATLRRPLGLSVDELFAPGSADQSHCVMRLRPGSPRRPDLLERLSNHEVTLALMSGEGRFPAIGVMVCDRPFSRLPVRRRDLWFLEILCRAIGQKIERRRLLARVDSYRHDAERDYLTGLYNRRYTMQQLEQKQAECRETGSALSLVLLDLDNFKAFNDTYGHLAGDTVLREIGQLLLETARACDVAGRYGGEEFLIVLPNTSVEHAFVFSERLRNVVEEYGRHQLGRFPDQPPTISIGVGSVSFDDTPESAIDRVDKALYASKQTGRNRVCLGLTDEERYVWLGQTETNGP